MFRLSQGSVPVEQDFEARGYTGEELALPIRSPATRV